MKVNHKKILFLDSTISATHSLIMGILVFDEKNIANYEITLVEQQNDMNALDVQLAQLLEKLNLRVNDLDGICVGIGPGSFTGIKVGLSFVYGLMAGCSKNILTLGISHLMGIEKKDDEAIFLRSTSHKGFCFFENKTISLDFSSHQKNEFIFKKIIVLFAWSELSSFPELKDKEIEYLNDERSFKMMVNSITKKILTHWPNGFSRELPQPIYIREVK